MKVDEGVLILLKVDGECFRGCVRFAKWFCFFVAGGWLLMVRGVRQRGATGAAKGKVI